MKTYRIGGHYGDFLVALLDMCSWKTSREEGRRDRSPLTSKGYIIFNPKNSLNPINICKFET